MNTDSYKLNFWKEFKTRDAREEVVRFVVKTLDIIAFPTITGETINKNLFQIT